MKTPCSYRACPNAAASGGGGYCLNHQSMRATKRRQPGDFDNFYRAVAWRKTSLNYRRKNPQCETCESRGKLTWADMVDHIHELKDGGAQLAEDNLMAICIPCHAEKTERMRQARAKGAAAVDLEVQRIKRIKTKG